MFRIPPCLEATFSKQPMQSYELKILEITLQYISKNYANFMVRMGLVIVIGAIIGSMVLANYTYMQYQTNFIEVK